MTNQRFHVFDWLGRVRPEWAIGRLCIAGAGLARGYWDNAALTAQRFVTRPSTGERLYVTGDLGRVRPNGAIEFLGREDFQVKIQGYRIEPGEIETVLAQHSAVGRAVVVAQGDNQDGRLLVAYIVLAGHLQSAEPTAAKSAARLADERIATALRDHLAKSLPTYMVPAVFVILPSLPVTTNGKIDRTALPDQRDLVPEPSRGGHGGLTANGGLATNRSHHLQAVTDAFAEVLGRIGITAADNFFTLGGTSLLAARLHHVLTRRTGIEVPMATLFRHGTVAELAASLDGAMQARTAGAEQPGPVATALKTARQRGEAMRKVRGGRYRR